MMCAHGVCACASAHIFVKLIIAAVPSFTMRILNLNIYLKILQTKSIQKKNLIYTHNLPQINFENEWYAYIISILT
jgi:hypothetical protein